MTDFTPARKTPKKPSLADHLKKNTMLPEDLEREILAFLSEASSGPGTIETSGCPLKHGLACVLCTVHKGAPRATAVDFFSDGMTLWIAGEPGLKIRNIRSSQKVAVGIYHPMDHSQLNRSMQIAATASLLTYAADKKAFMARLRKMGVYDAARKIMSEMFTAQGAPMGNFDQEVEKAMGRFNLIKIEPDEIIYLCIHPTEGTQKNIWKKPETSR